MPADDDTVYQLIAHLARQFGYIKVFLDVGDKIIHALFRRFRLHNFFFYGFNLRLECFLFGGVFFYKADTDIFGNLSFDSVFIGNLHQAGKFFLASTL